MRRISRVALHDEHMAAGWLRGCFLAEQHMVHALKAVFARAGIQAGTQVGAVLVPGLALRGIQLRYLALDLRQQRIAVRVTVGCCGRGSTPKSRTVWKGLKTSDSA